jgi:hypothetical protein
MKTETASSDYIEDQETDLKEKNGGFLAALKDKERKTRRADESHVQEPKHAKDVSKLAKKIVVSSDAEDDEPSQKVEQVKVKKGKPVAQKSKNTVVEDDDTDGEQTHAPKTAKGKEATTVKVKKEEENKAPKASLKGIKAEVQCDEDETDDDLVTVPAPKIPKALAVEAAPEDKGNKVDKRSKSAAKMDGVIEMPVESKKEVTEKKEKAASKAVGKKAMRESFSAPTSSRATSIEPESKKRAVETSPKAAKRARQSSNETITSADEVKVLFTAVDQTDINWATEVFTYHIGCRVVRWKCGYPLAGMHAPDFNRN